MLLQRLPGRETAPGAETVDTATVDDAWRRVQLIGETLTPEELRALRARVALVRGSGALATRTYTRSLETLYETMWRRSQG